ncbi:hypothetical protein ACIRJO_02630 [Streptomyces sp. NPDC102394]|uniref:hypothetical protein n=1 Tax=Streptomyces sp. NPDC102394 TaxID=3366167 RepID=UPI0037F68FEB
MVNSFTRNFVGPPSQLAVSLCASCGKACCASRRDAKRAARAMFPGVHHKVVQCGEYWHIQRVRGEGQ